MELGPLLQRARPGRRRAGPGLDQFQPPFDHQDEAGALPDSVTHSEVLYNYVKPPIHGWAFRQLRTPPPSRSPRRAAQTYDRLARWTRSGSTTAEPPGHDLPYYQHGNDSGWDNATTFDAERVIETPDLAAFLVLQLDALAELARAGPAATSQGGGSARTDAARAMLDELWDGERFVAVGAADRATERPAAACSTSAHRPRRRLPAESRRAWPSGSGAT